jgi:hypothetical protein
MATESGSGSSLSAPFEKELTDEGVQQLEKERAKRLDPQNRPRNAEVDNTTRHWLSDKEDFEDNLEGHPPEWDTSDGAGTKVDPEIWQRIEEQTGKPVERAYPHKDSTKGR